MSRGRPKSDKPALTNVERQRSYKERLKAQLSLVTENQASECLSNYASERLNSMGQPDWSPAQNRYFLATMLADLALDARSTVPLYGEPDVPMLVVVFIMQALKKLEGVES